MVRYLNPADHNSRKIPKSDKDFAKRYDSKDIKRRVEIKDIHKIKKKKKKNFIGISVFGYKNKEKHQIYVSKKCCEEKHVDPLLIGECEDNPSVLIKGFNAFMYDHSLHRRRKHFCIYCLLVFLTEEILKHNIKDSFKINGKQRIIIHKKGNYVKFKNFERKIKSPFLILGDFESILVPEDNRKKNPNPSCTNKYKKYVACSYGSKLVCVDDKFSNLFK